MTKLGIHANISNHDYHSGPGLSRSAIMEFRNTPRHYYDKYLSPHKIAKESTASMQLGSAVHTAVLEPDLFFQQYALKPECDRRTKIGKEIYENFCAANIGKTVITQEIYDKVLKMREAVLREYKHYLDGAYIEYSMYWEEKNTGILCKSRPDISHPNVILDLKTTSDASPLAFGREAENYGYFLQSAMIQDGLFNITNKFVDEFYMVCVEVDEPHYTITHQLSVEAIEEARDEFLLHLGTYKKCFEENYWPGYESSIIYRPPYAKRSI